MKDRYLITLLVVGELIKDPEVLVINILLGPRHLDTSNESGLFVK